MVTTVYLVRHGESDGNALGIFQGRIDSRLNEIGIIQAKKVGIRFKDIDYDVIYASPLLRAWETAENINVYHNLNIIKHDGLTEISGGVFEGCTWDQITEKFPKEYKTWSTMPHKFKADNSESMEDVYNRIAQAVNGIIKDNIGKTIVICSHACAIKNYLCYASGFGVEKIADIPWSKNTSVSKLTYDEKLNPNIEYTYDASHLDAE